MNFYNLNKKCFFCPLLGINRVWAKQIHIYIHSKKRSDLEKEIKWNFNNYLLTNVIKDSNRGLY